MTTSDATRTYPQPGAGEPALRTGPLASLRDRQRRLLPAAAVGVLVSALVTWLLYGPSGPFYRGWGFSGMAEYLNEVFGEGDYAGEVPKYLLLLVLAVPAVLGAVTRSWHWVWIAPLTFLVADFVLLAAAALTGTPHPYFPQAFGMLVMLLLYGVPAMVAAVVGVFVGQRVERVVRS